MRLCDKHWEEIRRALKDRGLEPWFAKSAVELEEIWDRDRDTAEGFEPLLGVTVTLVVAVAYYEDAIDTEECMLCELERIKEQCGCEHCRGKDWVSAFADNQLAVARDLKLLPRVN